MNKTIKLQGLYGHKEGTEANKLKVGDVLLWNYGYKEQILNITPSKTGKTITLKIKSLESDFIGTRRMSINRLVVLA
jgi:hypothetical protein